MNDENKNKRLPFSRHVKHVLHDVERDVAKAAGTYDHKAFLRSPEFLRSRDWLEVRYAALLRCGKMCMVCGARGMPSNPLHVDHIKPRVKFPELALDINNLQVLCNQCNFGKGWKDQTDHRNRSAA